MAQSGHLRTEMDDFLYRQVESLRLRQALFHSGL